MNVSTQVRDGVREVDAARAEEAALFALSAIGAPEASELSLTFVTDDEMASLNEEYRGKEGPTDVLSFECDNLDDAFPEPGEGEPYELGDVVVAPDVAARQASEFGNAYDDEVDMLVVHGVLHLCGYDHVTDEDAAVMEPLQDRVLSDLRAWRGSR